MTCWAVFQTGEMAKEKDIQSYATFLKDLSCVASMLATTAPSNHRPSPSPPTTPASHLDSSFATPDGKELIKAVVT